MSTRSELRPSKQKEETETGSIDESRTGNQGHQSSFRSSRCSSFLRSNSSSYSLSLTALWIHNNPGISGAVPDTLANLANLKYLYTHKTALTGAPKSDLRGHMSVQAYLKRLRPAVSPTNTTTTSSSPSSSPTASVREIKTTATISTTTTGFSPLTSKRRID